MSYIGDAIIRTSAVSSCYFPEEHNCSVLTCPIQPGMDLTIRILRCAHPPAMRMTLGSGFQTRLDYTFDHSEILPGSAGATYNVTVDHLNQNDIGFQVSTSVCILHRFTHFKMKIPSCYPFKGSPFSLTLIVEGSHHCFNACMEG